VSRAFIETDRRTVGRAFGACFWGVLLVSAVSITPRPVPVFDAIITKSRPFTAASSVHVPSASMSIMRCSLMGLVVLPPMFLTFILVDTVPVEVLKSNARNGGSDRHRLRRK
jgi:hypothetical protein